MLDKYEKNWLHNIMDKNKIKDIIICGLIVINLIAVVVATAKGKNAQNKSGRTGSAQAAGMQGTETATIEDIAELTDIQDMDASSGQDLLDRVAEQSRTITRLTARLREQSDTINLLEDANTKIDIQRRKEAAAKILALEMSGRFLNTYALEHGFTNEKHNREQEIDKFVMAAKFSLEEEASRLVGSGWNPYRLTKDKGVTGKSYFDIDISYEVMPLNDRTMLYLFSSVERFNAESDSVIGSFRDVFLGKIPSGLYGRDHTIDFERDF